MDKKIAITGEIPYVRIREETKEKLKELKNITKAFKTYDDVINHLINFFKKRAYEIKNG